MKFSFPKLMVIWLLVLGLAIPMSTAFADQGGNLKTQVTVMTRNLYLGADIFRVVDAALNPSPNPDGLDVPRAVAAVFGIVQETNFYERAEAIADEILKAKPDMIGIQEASTYYIQTPSDFMAGNPVQADTLFMDFYQILDAAMKARGLDYDAYAVTNADIELPMLDPGSSNYLSDVRLVDHDMILVSRKLASSLVVANNYANNLGLELAGVPVTFNRGYLIVDVQVHRNQFRFVNTHLEVSGEIGSVFRFIQDLQMQELLQTVAALDFQDPKQVIMVGDFNSAPEDVAGTAEVPDIGVVPYYPPYWYAMDFGYLDSWLLQKKYDDGYTSGFDEYVSDPWAQLTTRIDHIFLGAGGYRIEKVKSEVVGDEVKDMTPSGLWPSDHAGVVATVKFSEKWK